MSINKSERVWLAYLDDEKDSDVAGMANVCISFVPYAADPSGAPVKPVRLQVGKRDLYPRVK